MDGQLYSGCSLCACDVLFGLFSGGHDHHDARSRREDEALEAEWVFLEEMDRKAAHKARRQAYRSSLLFAPPKFPSR